MKTNKKSTEKKNTKSVIYYAVVKKRRHSSTYFLVSTAKPIDDFRKKVETDGIRTVIEINELLFEMYSQYYVWKTPIDGMTFYTSGN